MKTFVCLFLIVLAAVSAEPPRYRNSRFQFQRQELKPEGEEREGRREEAPYPAAGYVPSREFKLPSRQENVPPSTSYGVPANSYGAPFNTYSAPQSEYGVPRNTQERTEDKSEGGEESSGSEDAEELKVEGLGERRGKGKLRKGENSEEGERNEDDVINQRGAYYVLLPDSQLQRVQFQTENDLRNMAYTARLQYRNEEKAPVYVYTSFPEYQRASYVQLF